MSTSDTANETLLQLLNAATDSLEVPPSKYADAQERYRAVGDWLNADNSALAKHRPIIYPQGSFALGTAVRPIDDSKYDVDAVCLLQLDPDDISQQQLAAMVGDRLRENSVYRKMLDPKDGGRRCWTLKYADASKFYLDILPAIPDDPSWLADHGVSAEHARHAICITDRETWLAASTWPKSNPKGYVAWFKNRMRVVLEEGRRRVAKRLSASVDQVPDYEVRTPLQQAIQLLKRHRDVRFGDDENRPISIIITTLAAQAYDNERNVLETLIRVLPKMRAEIENRKGIYWVPSPVNPMENFADKWEGQPKKREAFLDWLQAVEIEHRQLHSAGSVRIAKYVREAYDVPVSEAVATPAGVRPLGSSQSLIKLSESQSSLSLAHRQQPRWPMRNTARVAIGGEHKSGEVWIPFQSGARLPKECSVRFLANPDVVKPFQIFWQVVNTGREAAERGQLRGEIFEANSAWGGGLRHRESTLYTGQHWVECFIVKNGQCVARSGEFIINIK